MVSSPENVTTTEQTASWVGQLVDERKDYSGWWTDDTLRASLPKLSPEDEDYHRRELAARRAESARLRRAPDYDDMGIVEFDPEPDPEPNPKIEAIVEVILPHLPKSPLSLFSSLFGSPEVQLRVQLDLTQEHFKITPRRKSARRRGRPKGSKTTNTKAEVDLWEQGLSDLAIYDRLKPSHVFDGGRARRAKIYTFSEEKQARIHAAHKAGKQALRQATLKKQPRKKESGSEFLS